MQLVRRGQAAAFEVIYERHCAGGVLARLPDGRLARRRRGRRAGGVPEHLALGRALRALARVGAHVAAGDRPPPRRSTRCGARSCTSAGGRATRGIEETLETGERTDVEVARHEEAATVRAALGHLPSEQSQVIELAYFGGFTHTEIAEMLETPVGTVKGRMRLGLEKMRHALGGGAGEPGMSDARARSRALGRRGRRLPARRAGAATSSERFEAHLADCPACRRDVADLQVAADALPVSVPPIRPPAALKGRIMAVVERGGRAARGRRRPRRRGRSPARRRRRRGALRPPGSMRPGVALACALALLAGGGAGRRPAERRRGRAHGRREHARRRAPTCGSRSATTARRSWRGHMPAPPSGPHLPGLAQAPRQATPSRRRCCGRRASDGSAEVAVPGSLDGVEAVLVTDEPEGGSRGADQAARDHRQRPLDLSAEPRLLGSALDGHLLPPSLARDGRLVLELRQADLPGLHDDDAGRDALPGLRAASGSRCTRCARCTSTRSSPTS